MAHGGHYTALRRRQQFVRLCTVVAIAVASFAILFAISKSGSVVAP